MAVGEKFGIKKCGNVLAGVSEAARNFKYYADKHGYSAEKASVIADLLRRHFLNFFANGK